MPHRGCAESLVTLPRVVGTEGILFLCRRLLATRTSFDPTLGRREGSAPSCARTMVFLIDRGGTIPGLPFVVASSLVRLRVVVTAMSSFARSGFDNRLQHSFGNDLAQHRLSPASSSTTSSPMALSQSLHRSTRTSSLTTHLLERLTDVDDQSSSYAWAAEAETVASMVAAPFLEGNLLGLLLGPSGYGRTKCQRRFCTHKTSWRATSRRRRKGRSVPRMPLRMVGGGRQMSMYCKGGGPDRRLRRHGCSRSGTPSRRRLAGGVGFVGQSYRMGGELP